jgi:hypothetical protein
MADKDKRKAHIFRIYKDDDSSSDVWVDIERIDALTFETGRDKDYRKWYFEYDWNSFDPEDTHTVEYKYITNDADSSGSSSGISTSKPTDGRDYIRVPVRKAITMEDGRDIQYQKSTYTHKNGSSDDTGTTRKVHKRRVKHYDIPKDSLDEKGQPPTDPKEYFDALDATSIDESNYIDVEVVDELITTTGSGYTWRKWHWTLGSDADSLLADPLKTKDGASGGDYFPLKPSGQ